jgi:hypothetical protein
MYCVKGDLKTSFVPSYGPYVASNEGGEVKGLSILQNFTIQQDWEFQLQ